MLRVLAEGVLALDHHQPSKQRRDFVHDVPARMRVVGSSVGLSVRWLRLAVCRKQHCARISSTVVPNRGGCCAIAGAVRVRTQGRDPSARTGGCGARAGRA